MLPSSAKAIPGAPPMRNASRRHRKGGKRHMGKFAESAAKFGPDQRGDGTCVAGRWITDNLDAEDLVEFARLANDHSWTRIIQLSESNLKEASLNRHAHGNCTCFSDVPGRGCCNHADKSQPF